MYYYLKGKSQEARILNLYLDLMSSVGCGKTSLMKLLLHLAPHKTNYEIISTRNIIFKFNTSGFEVLEKYTEK